MKNTAPLLFAQGRSADPDTGFSVWRVRKDYLKRVVAARSEQLTGSRALLTGRTSNLGALRISFCGRPAKGLKLGLSVWG